MTHAQAHEALAAFARVARDHGYKSVWDAYKDEANWVPTVREAHLDAMTKVHAYYEARDGVKGFLGGRGL